MCEQPIIYLYFICNKSIIMGCYISALGKIYIAIFKNYVCPFI